VDEGPWAGVRPLLDEVWYVEVSEELRLERLVERHVAFGKERAAAEAWSQGSDQRNAELIAATRSRADRIVLG
jgi:pantothenate kinase